jgi:hypothetical protein
MTKKRAERLMGYEVRELRAEGGMVTLGAFDGKRLIIKARAVVEWIALDHLVNSIYRIHSRKALEQHGWRCARCRRNRPLQIHHRRYRSHGGTHRVENLEPVCWDCHRLIHRQERSR